jgi:hypothetical protein
MMANINDMGLPQALPEMLGGYQSGWANQSNAAQDYGKASLGNLVEAW